VGTILDVGGTSLYDRMAYGAHHHFTGEADIETRINASARMLELGATLESQVRLNWYSVATATGAVFDVYREEHRELQL
jgi:hypothetical protein